MPKISSCFSSRTASQTLVHLTSVSLIHPHCYLGAWTHFYRHFRELKKLKIWPWDNRLKWKGTFPPLKKGRVLLEWLWMTIQDMRMTKRVWKPEVNVHKRWQLWLLFPLLYKVGKMRYDKGQKYFKWLRYWAGPQNATQPNREHTQDQPERGQETTPPPPPPLLPLYRT